MKRVLRIEREGTVKDVGLRCLATVPTVESVNVMVAHVQALIPLSLRARELLRVRRPSGGRLILECFALPERLESLLGSRNAWWSNFGLYSRGVVRVLACQTLLKPAKGGLSWSNPPVPLRPQWRAETRVR